MGKTGKKGRADANKKGRRHPIKRAAKANFRFLLGKISKRIREAIEHNDKVIIQIGDWECDFHSLVTTWLGKVETESRRLPSHGKLSYSLTSPHDPWAIDRADEIVCFSRHLIYLWLFNIRNFATFAPDMAGFLKDVLLKYEQKPWLQYRQTMHGMKLQFYPAELDVFDNQLVGLCLHVHHDLSGRDDSVFTFESWIQQIDFEGGLHQAMMLLMDLPELVAGDPIEVVYYSRRLWSIRTVYQSLLKVSLSPCDVPVGVDEEMPLGDDPSLFQGVLYQYMGTTCNSYEQCLNLGTGTPMAIMPTVPN